MMNICTGRSRTVQKVITYKRKQTLSSGSGIEQTVEETIRKESTQCTSVHIQETCRVYEESTAQFIQEHAVCVDTLGTLVDEETRCLTKVDCPQRKFEAYNMMKKSPKLTAREHGYIVKAQLAIGRYRESRERYVVAQQRQALLKKAMFEDVLQRVDSDCTVDLPTIDMPLGSFTGDVHFLRYVTAIAGRADVEVTGFHVGSRKGYVRFLDVARAVSNCILLNDLGSATNSNPVTINEIPGSGSSMALPGTNHHVTWFQKGDIEYMPRELDGQPCAPACRISKSRFGVAVVSSADSGERILQYVDALFPDTVVENVRGDLLCVELSDGWETRLDNPYHVNRLRTGNLFIASTLAPSLDAPHTLSRTLRDFSVGPMQRADLAEFDGIEGRRAMETIVYQARRLQAQCKVEMSHTSPVAEHTMTLLESRTSTSKHRAIFQTMRTRGLYDGYVEGLLNTKYQQRGMTHGTRVDMMLNDIRLFEMECDNGKREKVITRQHAIETANRDSTVTVPESGRATDQKTGSVPEAAIESRVRLFPEADDSRISWHVPNDFELYAKTPSTLRTRLVVGAHGFKPDEPVTANDRKHISDCRQAWTILNSKEAQRIDERIDGIHQDRLRIWQEDFLGRFDHVQFVAWLKSGLMLDHVVLRGWSLLHWLLAIKWYSTCFHVHAVTERSMTVLVCPVPGGAEKKTTFYLRLPLHWRFSMFSTLRLQPLPDREPQTMAYDCLDACDAAQARAEDEFCDIYLDAHFRFSVEFPFHCVREM